MDKTQEKLANLKRMPLPELKQMWHKYFDYNPPRYDRDYMMRRVAYHIQVLAYGGLSKKARNKLQRLAFGNQNTMQDRYCLKPGIKLIKEYKDRRLIVNVREKGFEYEGRLYKTLTMVAREITGTHTSGPAFFGVKESRHG